MHKQASRKILIAKNCCITWKLLHKQDSTNISDKEAKKIVAFSGNCWISIPHEEFLIGKLKTCCIYWKLLDKHATRKLSDRKAEKLLDKLGIVA